MAWNRLKYLGIMLLVAAGPALSDTAADRVVEQLRRHGYTEIEVSRTWLGRTRIFATAPQKSREIILNPRTGEVLRDHRRTKEDAFEDLFEGDEDDRDKDDSAGEESGEDEGGQSSDDGDDGGDDDGGDDSGDDGGDGGGDDGGDDGDD